MHPFHILISVFNLLCGFTLLALFILQSGPYPSLATFAVFGGYIANALAVLIALILVFWIVLTKLLKAEKVNIKKHWLGIFNGAFVVTIWVLVDMIFTYCANCAYSFS